MYKIEIMFWGKYSKQAKTLSFDTYEEFSSGYWDCVSDPSVVSFEVL